MDLNKKYRDNGAVGALLDEYERALKDLNRTLDDVTPHELTAIVDSETQDSRCRSIQTILSHVVLAGYWYVLEVRKAIGESIAPLDPIAFDSVEEYKDELAKMFMFNEKLFIDYPDLKVEERDPEKQVLVKWGQRYDVEQLFEHAIVHILRHRRQIERFKLRLRQ